VNLSNIGGYLLSINRPAPCTGKAHRTYRPL
jgi:hypothetical protein